MNNCPSSSCLACNWKPDEAKSVSIENEINILKCKKNNCLYNNNNNNNGHFLSANPSKL